MLALLLACAMILGCDRRAPSEALQELRLGYFANATHAQAVLGVESGEFAQAIAPVALKTRVFNAGPSLIEALFAGEIDIGYIGPGPVLSAHQRSKGRGVRVISGAAANGVVIVARKDSGIASMQDLKGKRIATPQHGNTQDIAARRYVTEVLGQDDHRNVLPVPNAEQSSMMSRGQIDAAWVPEPWGARLVAETGATIIAEEKDLWPGGEFSLTVVIASSQFLQRHPDLVEKLLGVHTRMTAQLNQDFAGSLSQLDAALFKLTGKQLPPGVLEAALRRIHFTVQPLEQTFAIMGQWSYELGFSQRPASLQGLFDLSLLHRVQQTQQGPSPR